MNLRLGIYEIFSRVVPGGLYLAALAQLAHITGLLTVDPKMLENVSLLASFGLLIGAYIISSIFDPLALALFRLAKKPGQSARSLAEFKERHKTRWLVDFDDAEWGILLAHIRTRNLDLANEIDRHNALSIMLRNLSLGLLFMAVNSLIQYFIASTPVSILLSAFLLVASIALLREAVKFRGWFYNTIYETIVALRLDVEKRVTPLDGKKKTR